MQQKIIIAIDGYSSCGKSTLAKQLAKELHYIYADSGAMYRAITLYFLRNSIHLSNHSQIKETLNNIHLSFEFDVDAGKSHIFLNDENVELAIREMIINQKVSEVAAIKEIREFAVQQQQHIGKNKGVVMDGRDIGTTVFPQAALKIFMIADIKVRVERRFKELSEKNPDITIEEVKQNLEMRDYIDSNREISPLRKATDSIILDNTNLTMAQQLKLALQWANEKISSSKKNID
ncbi:MAG: (d)CMP kinase [Parafilimonas sp.]